MHLKQFSKNKNLDGGFTETGGSASVGSNWWRYCLHLFATNLS